MISLCVFNFFLHFLRSHQDVCDVLNGLILFIYIHNVVLNRVKTFQNAVIMNILEKCHDKCIFILENKFYLIEHFVVLICVIWFSVVDVSPLWFRRLFRHVA